MALVALTAALGLSACGEDAADSAADPVAAVGLAGADSATGISVVTPDDAAATIANAADDLVILDVRTPEEYAEGHIEGATLIDFYRDDFAEQLAALDPDVPYVLYCRSGNRSGQARSMMDGLGFVSVEDIDGGVVGWTEAGLPLVTD